MASPGNTPYRDRVCAGNPSDPRQQRPKRSRIALRLVLHAVVEYGVGVLHRPGNGSKPLCQGLQFLGVVGVVKALGGCLGGLPISQCIAPVQTQQGMLGMGVLHLLCCEHDWGYHGALHRERCRADRTRQGRRLDLLGRATIFDRRTFEQRRMAWKSWS